MFDCSHSLKLHYMQNNQGDAKLLNDYFYTFFGQWRDSKVIKEIRLKGNYNLLDNINKQLERQLEESRTEIERRSDYKPVITLFFDIKLNRYNQIYIPTRQLSMEIQELVKDLFEGKQLRIMGTIEEPLFVANDIGAILGLTKIRNTINDYDDTKKVILPIKTIGGIQNMTMLTEKGLRSVIASSRTVNAEKIRQAMNHKVGYAPPVKESEFITAIMKIFVGEVFEMQKQVLGYRIDLYMPAYKLAIEYDEGHHQISKG